MKCLIFGTGDYYERYKKWLENEEIVALIDNSCEKQGMYLDGHIVISPDQVCKYEYDNILILSFYYNDMREQLLQYGVDPQKIYHFYSIRQIVDWKKNKKDLIGYGDYKRILDMQTIGRKVLLLSPELNNGGPAIALFHVALILKKKGMNILVASMIDGELREKYLNSNISVVIDNNLQMSVMKEEEWTSKFDLIICNTLNFHVFLSERNIEIPCIWWLHEADFFYAGVNKDNLDKISLQNLKVVAVGEIPKNALEKYRPDILISDLLYYVRDVTYGKQSFEGDDIFRIALIGYLEEIKGQDILLKALQLMPTMYKKNIYVYIVGKKETLYGKTLMTKYKDVSNVLFTGELDRSDIHRLLDKIDILVCPSRQDSMPTVVAEAMMHSKASIISDAVGMKKYIRDKFNGLIFQSESVEGLIDKIEYCMENCRELITMGKNARKIYETQFSVEAFENQLMNLIEALLRKNND